MEGALRGGGKQSEVQKQSKLEVLSEVEGSIHWRREAIGGGGERSEVEGSDQRWREAIRGGGEQSEVDWSDQRQREAIRG